MQPFEVRLSSGDHGESLPRFTLIARLDNPPASFEEGHATTEDGIYAHWGTLPEEWRLFLCAMINRPEITEISGKSIFDRAQFDFKLAPVDFEDLSGFMANLANATFYTTRRELNVRLPAIKLGQDSVVIPTANGLFRWDGFEALELQSSSSLSLLTPCGRAFLGRVLRETRAECVRFCRALEPVALTLPSAEKLHRAIFGGEPVLQDPKREDTQGYEDHLFSHRTPTIIYPSPVTADDLMQLNELLMETIGLRLSSF